ncbi:unnamed protein product [Adineta steineri]|uniref:Uncharacterized protein n=1 Tax=Adineta steineri TaxID=433720 RepID=A0A815I1N9_9BILA|nr:unnamed protein product [Adineta steineri]CAF1456663.1 unnamed protein product [Adineta steineri]CAF3741112.1 unnamed protein product [Adineta steineri]CAF3850283.1 unnamed protein product [Adineta steineri]
MAESIRTHILLYERLPRTMIPEAVFSELPVKTPRNPAGKCPKLPPDIKKLNEFLIARDQLIENQVNPSDRQFSLAAGLAMILYQSRFFRFTQDDGS